MDWREDLQKRIIIDNGACQIKYGSCVDETPQLMTNLVAHDKKSGQQYTGDQLQNIINESNLIYYKQQVRGVVVDWDNQIQLWEKCLKEREKIVQTSSLTLTYHPGCPEKVKARMMEVAFDYFHFDAFYPALNQAMVREYYMSEFNESNPLSPHFQLVIESSHSATYFVPFFDGEPINYAIKRLDIGGKVLTKYLLDLINIKYIQLKNEYRMTQQIKEQMCYISNQFKFDMKQKPGSHAKYFILPDLDTGKKGFVVDEKDTQSYAQYMPLDKERFMIPEAIFNPPDIGLQQNGITQAIYDCINCLNSDIKDYFLENIIISGGNSLFQNLVPRLQQELRENTPHFLNTKVNHIDEIYCGFFGAQEVNQSEDFINMVVKKQDYKEYGQDRLSKMYFV